jgi:hypothetical protein
MIGGSTRAITSHTARNLLADRHFDIETVETCGRHQWNPQNEGCVLLILIMGDGGASSPQRSQNQALNASGRARRP